MYENLKTRQDEIDRLAGNSRAMFDMVPDMLFIIKDDYFIERMNKAAFERFGDQQGGRCYDVILKAKSPCVDESCPFSCSDKEKVYGRVFEKKLSDSFYVEYTHVPFEGYRNEHLSMLVLRDVTQKKLNEIQLEQYSKNIEVVLREKIAQLKERESERKKLLKEMNYLKKEAERFTGQDTMIGDSRPIRRLREMIHQVAESRATVIITGESGTGKELVADLLYKNSNRKGKPYLKFNCAAISESLLESDLFGYEKGAFTGAVSSHKGKFEHADGGTIFLDEIGNISPRMQSGLLRVLQEGELTRLGANESIKVDVRIIAATNKNLAEAVKNGHYREDLYYRLNVINLHLVPLRERKEDILPLASAFLYKYRELFKKDITFLPSSVVELILAYDWPGNVRELENFIQRAVLLSREGVISADDLGLYLENTTAQEEAFNPAYIEKFLSRPLKESISAFEAEVIGGAIKANNGRLDEICETLGLAKTTFYEKVKRYGLKKQKIKNRKS